MDPQHLDVLAALTNVDPNNGENNVTVQKAILAGLANPVRYDEAMFLCAEPLGEQAAPCRARCRQFPLIVLVAWHP